MSSSTKQKLMAYQKKNIYLFHGSSRYVKELEPRQPLTWNEETQQMLLDGNPAVVATSFVDIAIFRAVIAREGWSTFGYDGKNFSFEASEKTIEQSRKTIGYVYVLSKDSFEKVNSMEWRSAEKVKPIKVIEVGFEDLPQNIQIVEKQSYSESSPNPKF
ncbi:MAG: hypothetical protein WEC84_00300 [Candidatus Andersenbacteria bacterium]